MSGGSPGGRLILATEAQRAMALTFRAAGDLVLLVDHTVGGAWTEIADGEEIIRFGLPSAPRSRWLSLDATPAGPHTALSIAIERIVYARGLRIVMVLSESLVPSADRGTAGYGGVVSIDLSHVSCGDPTNLAAGEAKSG